MPILEETKEYEEALHFCSDNPPVVVARQMAKDMVRLKEALQLASIISCTSGVDQQKKCEELSTLLRNYRPIRS